MNIAANNTESFEELDYRESDGIQVSLLWSRADGTVSVAVHDARTAERFQISVEPERALDAFQHPFAYAGESVTDVMTNPLEQAVIELDQQTLAH